jgi:murein DD-endopeptidase MepM/ murein hydrolase activator NlpD
MPHRRVYGFRSCSAWTILTAVLASGGLCLLQAATVQPFSADISHRARGVFPGEAVLVRVVPSAPVTEIKGDIFDETIHFYPADGAAWEGLVGVDLLVEPGAYDLTLLMRPVGSAPVQRAYPLTVAHKSYPTRQLTVAPRYVEPPPDVSARIAREAQEQQAIFASASPDRLWRGPWGVPVSGRATSAFGSRSVFNGQSRSPHSGADFRAAEGTPIVAPNVGRVVLTGDTYFSGGSVILDHGWGLYSYFAHLSKISVEDGELIERGQTVGLAGATGRVTGPHLHWTLRMNGARVDPLSVIELLAK